MQQIVVEGLLSCGPGTVLSTGDTDQETCPTGSQTGQLVTVQGATGSELCDLQCCQGIPEEREVSAHSENWNG